MAIPQDPVGYALQLLQQGRLPEARDSLQRVLSTAPVHAEALHLAGVVELQAGAPGAAVAFLSRCVDVAPGVAFAWSNLGVAYSASGDFTNALRCHEKTLALEPGNPVVLKNLGIALRYLGRHEDAMARFRQAAARAPGDAELHRETGDLLVDMGKLPEALQRYDRALALNPNDAAALHNRGFAAYRMGDSERALEDYRAALQVDARFARALSSIGVVLNERGESAQAAAMLARALEIEPASAQFHNNLGVVLDAMGNPDAALESYGRALAIDPDYAEALANRAATHDEMKRHGEARADYERAIALAPALPHAAGHLLHAKMHLCDWSGFEESVARIRAALEAGEPAAQPFHVLSVDIAPALQRACSQMYARHLERATPVARWNGPSSRRVKIRVGYFSADFRNHPVAFLVAPLAEHHDRDRFETIAFSYGPDTGDATRKRLERAFDRFEDVRTMTDAEVVALARRHEIDIAIDLMGHTRAARFGLLARRVAPVQAQYLGYPGTMGTAAIDYLIADATVVPEEHFGHYSESLVLLPDTYQANDLAREIGPAPRSRAELGLPADGFVFCCFNNKAKITPEVFGLWMRLLASVPGSVLWLVHGEDLASENLRREAAARGVDPRRLVFAPRVPLADHLARARHADLFVDTLPYNGHATTSDTLLAGVPGVATLGEGFAGRVSASLLRAVGLPELVAGSLREYEALAQRLATHPGELASIRERLARQRATHALFDVRRFARHLEAAYAAMDARHRAGQPPGTIRVAAIP